MSTPPRSGKTRTLRAVDRASARIPLEPFTLKDPTLEELAQRLAKLYSDVKLSHYPMFSWVQIINDGTILGEDLRRGPDRNKEAIRRAGKIMMRLLEFVGYYTYVHASGSGTLADLVAQTFQKPSYVKRMRNLREGPTRWILHKYPYACSKCGEKTCGCVVKPWVLENRREEPELYEPFKVQANNKRDELPLEPPLLTLESMLVHFRKIYLANYYHQDPWKIGMHLSEEIGEATTELSRLELRWLAEKAKFDVTGELSDAFKIASGKLAKQTARIKKKKSRIKRSTEVALSFQKLQSDLTADPWGIYGWLVGEKLKEEIADVFSWLAAIIVKLDPRLREFRKFPELFAKEAKGGGFTLACPWCRRDYCYDGCLISHGISSEVTENLSKF